MAGYLTLVYTWFVSFLHFLVKTAICRTKILSHMTCSLEKTIGQIVSTLAAFLGTTWAPPSPCRSVATRQRMVSIQQHRRNGAYEAGDITGWSAVEVFSKRVKDFVPGWAITNGRRTLCVYILDDRVHKKHLVAGCRSTRIFRVKSCTWTEDNRHCL